MILLLIQSVIVVKVTNVKAAVSGKRQIPVEVVSLTVPYTSLTGCPTLAWYWAGCSVDCF